MSNNYQDINNEVNDSYSSIVSMKYYVKSYISSKWTHRDVEYNNAGIPIIRLYVGETKKIYKKAFINGVDSNLNIIVPNAEFVSNTEDKIYSGYGQSNYVILKGENVGTAYLSTSITGTIESSYTNVIDNDIIIIVEKEPIITRLKWGHENPLMINSKTSVKLSLKTIYDNGQELNIDKTILEKLIPISSNPHCVTISIMYEGIIILPGQSYNGFGAYMLDVNNLDDRCQIKISDASIKETFGDNIKNIEPLTIITHKEIDPEQILSANFKVEYEKELPLIDINSTYNITIYGIYELPDGKIIRYNIDDIYKFTSLDESIVNTNSKNNTLFPKNLGSTQIIGQCSKVNSEFTVIPKEIIWDVRIIKTLSSIDWTIDKTTLTIDVDFATMQVIATYTDGSMEDISNNCSFKYNSDLIRIEGNKIIPIAPGSTYISILSSFETGDVDSNKVFNLTIIQQTINTDVDIEGIDIIEETVEGVDPIILNNTELELYVGDSKDLKYVIRPINAMPQPVYWLSSDDSIVSIDDTGHLNVLKEGYARIYVGIKNEETDYINNEDINEEDIEFIYGNIWSTCSINARVIKVTDIKLSTEELTLYVGDDTYYYDVIVEPEQAANKEVSISFESDMRKGPIAYDSSDFSIDAIREGSGILKVTSIDNPTVSAEMKITVIDNRVQKVIINPGNDTEYEWFDDFTKSPEVEMNDVNISEHEKWDDDDFPRYYCPVNNSLQLTATILPDGANYSDLIWYSSDGKLVKVTENGIITPIRRGIQELEMYGDDNINHNSRFPNTCWITAVNKKNMKSGVCQVRVTRNNITKISISELNEHDYDEDIFDENGNAPTTSEYNSDYVLWLNDEANLPVTLSVQDPNFGPSNDIIWKGSIDIGGAANWEDIVYMTNTTINHSNKNDDFDWTSNVPANVNSNKKSLNVKLKGVGLGTVHFYAAVKNNEKYYASVGISSGITNKNGYVKVGDYSVTVKYYGTNGSGKTKLSDKKGVLNANVTLTSNRKFIVDVPIMYDKYGNEQYVAKKYSKNCNRIEVTIEKDNQPLENATVLINAYRKFDTLKQIADKTDSTGLVTCPSINEDDYGFTDVNSSITDNAKPGEGEWKSVDNSRTIRVKVVTTPNDIYVTFRSLNNVITRGLPTYKSQKLWPPQTMVKVKNNSSKTIPIFLWLDEEFEDLLTEYKDGNTLPLDDKYMSFAWFSSDPNVFVIEERKETDPSIPNIKGTHIHYNNCGYGRYMNIVPVDKGIATLTIVNIMSGKTWERLIKVE